MDLFEQIYKETFLLESVSNTKINKAISGMHPVSIVYDDQKGGKGKGPRIIYPVAYGLTTANNPVVRAFQPSGDTKRGVPKWKYFRVDRIKSWNIDMKNKFDGDSLEGFMSNGSSETGDDSMSVIYNIAPIGNARYIHKQNKLKNSDFSNEKEIEIDDKPITKDDVKNIDVEETPKTQTNSKYSAKQIINNLISRIKDSNFGQKVQNILGKKENPIDNTEQKTDINNNLMTAPDAKPVTKQEINNGEETGEKEENNSIPKQTDEPVTHDDVSNVKDNELTKSYNDMMNRMNNLYKEE